MHLTTRQSPCGQASRWPIGYGSSPANTLVGVGSPSPANTLEGGEWGRAVAGGAVDGGDGPDGSGGGAPVAPAEGAWISASALSGGGRLASTGTKGRPGSGGGTVVEAVVGAAAIGAGVAAVTAGVAGGSGYTCTSPPDCSCTSAYSWSGAVRRTRPSRPVSSGPTVRRWRNRGELTLPACLTDLTRVRLSTRRRYSLARQTFSDTVKSVRPPRCRSRRSPNRATRISAAVRSQLANE